MQIHTGFSERDTCEIRRALKTLVTPPLCTSVSHLAAGDAWDNCDHPVTR